MQFLQNGRYIFLHKISITDSKTWRNVYLTVCIKIIQTHCFYYKTKHPDNQTSLQGEIKDAVVIKCSVFTVDIFGKYQT